MTEADKIKALVGYRLEQTDEALRAAEANLKEGLARSTVNRAYYAMFYAALALLAIEKKETSRHSAVLALFDQLFVKPKFASKDLSTWFHEAFALRQRSDYGTEPQPTVERATTTLANARGFVEQTRALVRERLDRLGASASAELKTPPHAEPLETE